MSDTIDALQPGDIVEIAYRVWRTGDCDHDSDRLGARWITAHVFACERGTWPLARLADGQVTEIRPYMTWRAVFRAPRQELAA